MEVIPKVGLAAARGGRLVIPSDQNVPHALLKLAVIAGPGIIGSKVLANPLLHLGRERLRIGACHALRKNSTRSCSTARAAAVSKEFGSISVGERDVMLMGWNGPAGSSSNSSHFHPVPGSAHPCVTLPVIGSGADAQWNGPPSLGAFCCPSQIDPEVIENFRYECDSTIDGAESTVNTLGPMRTRLFVKCAAQVKSRIRHLQTDFCLARAPVHPGGTDPADTRMLRSSIGRGGCLCRGPHLCASCVCPFWR